MDMFIGLIVNFIPVLIAILLHEIAHGYMAFLLGDDTAKRQGRLSLNPIKHVDYFGTIILPALLIFSKAGFIFGWAKPVPVNFQALRNPKRDVILVSAAGIIMNLLLAAVSAVLLHLTPYISHPFLQAVIGLFFLNMIVFNIFLAVFNALPIPPLDGSKILFGWLDKPWAVRYVNADRIGLAALVLLAFILPEIGRSFGVNLNLFGMYVIRFSKFLISFLV